MPNDLAFFIGALVAVFLVSRLIWFVARRWPDSVAKAVVISLISGTVAVILSALGHADGGPMNFDTAPHYVTAQLVVLAMDFWRIRRKQPDPA